MEFNAKVDYDEEEDSIYIYDVNKRVRSSLDFEFGVIDLNSSDNVVGIEILNASDFFEANEKLLKQAEGGRVRTLKKRGMLGAKFMVKLPKRKLRDTMIVPTRKIKA